MPAQGVPDLRAELIELAKRPSLHVLLERVRERQAPRAQDPGPSRSGPAVSLVVDAALVVAALVDTGPDGVWAESTLLGGGLAAPHLMLSRSPTF